MTGLCKECEGSGTRACAGGYSWLCYDSMPDRICPRNKKLTGIECYAKDCPPCPGCNGTGECQTCHGQGSVFVELDYGLPVYEDCPDCYDPDHVDREKEEAERTLRVWTEGG